MPKKRTKAVSAPGNAARNGADKPPLSLQCVETVDTLKDLRKATLHTQDDLADALGVGQGTISRIEKRDDMLVSTLQHYVESLGGTLHLLVTFPNRSPLVVERLGKRIATPTKDDRKKPAVPNGQAAN